MKKSVIIIVILFIIINIVSSRQNRTINDSKPTSLPQQPETPIVAFATEPPVDPTMQVGPYQCPVKKEFCEQGKPLTLQGVASGIGWILPKQTPILAAFDGELTSFITILPKEQNGEKLTTIYLDNKKRGLRGIYYYKGGQSILKTVKVNDQIAASNDTISLYNASVVFQLIKGDVARSKQSILTLGDFRN